MCCVTFITACRFLLLLFFVTSLFWSPRNLTIAKKYTHTHTHTLEQSQREREREKHTHTHTCTWTQTHTRASTHTHTHTDKQEQNEYWGYFNAGFLFSVLPTLMICVTDTRHEFEHCHLVLLALKSRSFLFNWYYIVRLLTIRRKLSWFCWIIRAVRHVYCACTLH